jgi:hypothetical protein
MKIGYQAHVRSDLSVCKMASAVKNLKSGPGAVGSNIRASQTAQVVTGSTAPRAVQSGYHAARSSCKSQHSHTRPTPVTWRKACGEKEFPRSRQHYLHGAGVYRVQVDP